MRVIPSDASNYIVVLGPSSWHPHSTSCPPPVSWMRHQESMDQQRKTVREKKQFMNYSVENMVKAKHVHMDSQLKVWSFNWESMWTTWTAVRHTHHMEYDSVCSLQLSDFHKIDRQTIRIMWNESNRKPVIWINTKLVCIYIIFLPANGLTPCVYPEVSSSYKWCRFFFFFLPLSQSPRWVLNVKRVTRSRPPPLT